MISIKDHNSDTNVRKIMCNNLNLDLVNINAYTKNDKIRSIYFKILSGNQIMMDRQTDGMMDGMTDNPNPAGL